MTSRRLAASEIDPFRKRHERQASLMWLGVLAGLFSDHELRLLDDLGFLSQHDHNLLRQAALLREAQP